MASAQAIAAEPAWWTEQKRACGLPPGLAYNQWNGECRGESRRAQPPAVDYEAERRRETAAAAAAAEAAERERQAEVRRRAEAAERQAEFDRSRDAAAATLRGSSGTPSTSDSGGLRGSVGYGLRQGGHDGGRKGSSQPSPGDSETALTALPAMPEIPLALPESARAPLIARRQPLALRKVALMEEADLIRQQCAAPRADCGARQKSFDSKAAALGVQMEKLSQAVNDAISAEKKRLAAREQQIEAAIAKDVLAIQRLGFARRAEDFAEWEKLGADARSGFQKEVIDAATDQIAGKVGDRLLEGFKHFDAASAARWIKALEKVEPRPVELIGLAQKVAGSADKAIVVEDARRLVQGIERIQQASAAKGREDMLLLGLDLICDVVPPPGDGSCNAFKSTGKLTAASLYNNAARRVAINEVERLTTMTEAQLRGLAKLNELMVKHVKERNDVRAKLKQL